jgi:CDP-diacylglycerol---glycerol-3-phosphate 3-phosphatidyltransferase
MSAGSGWFSGRVARAGDGPVSVANVANIITVARILVAPVVLWLVVVVDAGNWGVWRFVAAALFIVAISTDGVDGALARKRNLITTSGVLMDPIADKALTGAAFIALALVAELPWWVVIVILGREVLITAFRFAVLSKKVIPASRGGKAKTISQAITLGFWLTPAWVVVGEWILVVNWVLMGVAVVLTVVTGLDYLVRGLRGGKTPDAK